MTADEQLCIDQAFDRLLSGKTLSWHFGPESYSEECLRYIYGQAGCRGLVMEDQPSGWTRITADVVQSA